MTYLIDTDWVVDYLLGKPQATQALKALEKAGLAISVVTFGEVYEGIYHARDPLQAEAGFLGFLAWVDVLELSPPIFRRYAQLRGHLRRTGQLIGEFDLLIAATAIQHELTLVTRNLKHYQRIPELKLYRDPPAP